MATQKQAKQAREENSDFLKDLGVHAISVDKVTTQGKNTFAVIAHIEKLPDTKVTEFEIKSNVKSIKVPLVFLKSEKFNLE